jgi:Tetratricopeptide repeat
MRSLIAIVFAMLFVPVISLADGAGAGVEYGTDDARERFRRGVEFYREGSYDAALAEFTKAYEIAPDYRVLYNLAQVQSERRDYAAALKLVDDYVKRGQGEISEERLEQVRSWVPQLKTRVAVLWVHCDLDDLELLIDGLPSAKLPQSTPLLVNAGVHQLQLRRHGYESVTREIVIAGGEKVRVELPAPVEIGVSSTTVVSVETIPPAPDQRHPIDLTPHADAASVDRTPLWISLISAAVLAGGAVTFGALASSSESELDRELGRLPADRDRVSDLRSQIEVDAALCDAFAAAAVVGAGISLYFALSTRGEAPPSNRTDPSVRARAFDRALTLTRHF